MKIKEILEENNLRFCVCLSESEEMETPMIAIGINPCGKSDKHDQNLSFTVRRLQRIAQNEGRHSLFLINITPVIAPTVKDLLEK
ncbi:MAG: DUF1643 domain-containing protein, partial [Bacteroidaceae bacterium]|nr:DUF1643 domain-containing protein [Bacteroidales bacterium]MCF0185962.1 DUF1643 domain-containing protein [Bacteroidaceae bacterium]